MRRVILTAGVLAALNAYSQNFEAGESIFKANCTACHKMDAKLIGPPLQNTVAEQGFDWTKKWIYDNQALRDAGDSYANEVFEEYNKQIMPPYSYLSDEELTDLVTYLQDWKNAEAEAIVAEENNPVIDGKSSNPRRSKIKREMPFTLKITLAALVFVFLMISATIFTLFKAFKTMLRMNKELHDKIASS